jgi:hypothetical protein
LAASPQISAAAISEGGILRHEVQSDFQAGTTAIRVLLPEGCNRCCRYPVVFVLPVEAGDEHRYGDGLAEVARLGLHNRHQVICVQPTFSHLPWYADHPTDPTIRQESYFLEVVMPFVERQYPISCGSANRLLLGFSKSGWGAWSLLLRHPDRFGRAAAWDAPLAMASPSKFRMDIVFPTQASFEPYRISTALQRQSPYLRCQPRLGLFGYGNFRDQMEEVHREMYELCIPHVYHDGPPRAHTWSSGWLPEAMEFLIGRSCR